MGTASPLSRAGWVPAGSKHLKAAEMCLRGWGRSLLPDLPGSASGTAAPGLALRALPLRRSSGNISWLIPVVSRSDEGFYECTATSRVGVTRAGAYLSVSGGGRVGVTWAGACLSVSGGGRSVAWHGLSASHGATFAEPPPRLLALGNVTASPGQDVVMSCLVLSDVPYNLTWSWDGQVAVPGDGRTRLLQNGSLEIGHVQPGNRGLYECVAQSAHGTATASLWLFVQGKHCCGGPWPGWCHAPSGGGWMVPRG